MRITLVETLDHLLNAYDRQIAEYAGRLFVREGIDLKLNTRWARGLHCSLMRLLLCDVTVHGLGWAELGVAGPEAWGRKGQVRQQCPARWCKWGRTVCPLCKCSAMKRSAAAETRVEGHGRAGLTWLVQGKALLAWSAASPPLCCSNHAECAALLLRRCAAC